MHTYEGFCPICGYAMDIEEDVGYDFPEYDYVCRHCERGSMTITPQKPTKSLQKTDVDTVDEDEDVLPF